MRIKYCQILFIALIVISIIDPVVAEESDRLYYGNPDVVTKYNAGLSSYKNGDYEEAIQYFDEALAIDPKFRSAWAYKGLSLDYLGRNEEMLIAFERAVEVDPDYQEGYFYKGNALYKLGRYKEAIQEYDKSLEMEPDDRKAWYNKGLAYENLGMSDSAEKSFEKADPPFWEKLIVYGLIGLAILILIGLISGKPLL